MGIGVHAEFSDIEFGYSDASTESAENPDLLVHAFYDQGHLVAKALRGRPFLFLGYKGSGKTAIAERASLLHKDSPDCFVTIEEMGQFSYMEFKAATGGGADQQTRYPTTWSYLLLLQLIKSVTQDEGGLQNSGPEFQRVARALETTGLAPVPTLGQLVKRSTKKSLKGGVPQFLEGVAESQEESHDLRMQQMVAILQAALDQFKTSSRHVVILDGLDSIMSQRELQFQSLAALVSEVDRLNKHFKRENQPFKFVVLCRRDIFDRLPGANTAKLLQDSSYELDWFDDPQHPKRTRLVKVVNLRAQTSLRRRGLDVFDEFLPARVDGKGVRNFLLDGTRHTPRDILQLMRRLQNHSAGAGRLTPRQVKAGVRDYSTNYFVSEIRNELAGYLASEDIERAVTLLSSVRRPRIPEQELRDRAAKLGYGALDIDVLLNALFDCSAIGTREERGANRPLFTFKYRNRTATYIPGSTIWIHPGAWKGLNIEEAPPRRQQQRERSAR